MTTPLRSSLRSRNKKFSLKDVVDMLDNENEENENQEHDSEFDDSRDEDWLPDEPKLDDTFDFDLPMSDLLCEPIVTESIVATGTEYDMCPAVSEEHDYCLNNSAHTQRCMTPYEQNTVMGDLGNDIPQHFDLNEIDDQSISLETIGLPNVDTLDVVENHVEEQVVLDDNILTIGVNNDASNSMLSHAVVYVEAPVEVHVNSRKRRRSIENWKRNERKQLRNSGQSYITGKGKLVSKREMKQSNCAEKKCRLKCHINIPEEKRGAIFEHYWNDLSSYQRQQDFLGSHMEVVNPKQKTVEGPSRRSKTAVYHFTVDSVRIKVCKHFFTQTLGETPDRIRYHMEKKHGSLGSALEDGRGRHQQQIKIDGAAIQNVHMHIQSYPAVESHYCRSGTNRKYLPEGLTTAEMYREYCNDYCVKKLISPVKLCTYRKIFCNDYNYGFHVRKKDQCTTCNKYKNTPIPQRLDLEPAYNRHQERKEQSRVMKNSDKELSKDNASVCAVTFDLQKVLVLGFSLPFWKSWANIL
jgi:hypothetical protein